MFALEAIVAVASFTGLALGIVHHVESHDATTIPGEGKRVVAFRQVANRICTEHRGNLHRALDEAHGRVERLNFVARAIGWDVNDLESITPPPSRAVAFLDEVSVRRRSRPEVLALQNAIELRRPGAQARAISDLNALEYQSREISRSAGIVRCAKMLPATALLTSP